MLIPLAWVRNSLNSYQINGEPTYGWVTGSGSILMSSSPLPLSRRAAIAATPASPRSRGRTLKPRSTGATAAIGSVVGTTGGGASTTGSTQPGAAACAALLEAAAAVEPQRAALEPTDPSALRATHGLSTAASAAEDALAAATAGVLKPNVTIVSAAAIFIVLERLTCGLPGNTGGP